MCASAISWARINKLYYATKDKKFGAIDSTAQFFSQKNQNYKPKVSSGLLEQESAKLLKDFFHTKRKK
jgi:tRNA(Arg) A34 adenosine deaminase TadA